MLLKPAVPDVEPGTAVFPPRINGVRHPPKQSQPNVPLSVMQQQMTDSTTRSPCISERLQRGGWKESVKPQCSGEHRGYADMQPFLLCLVLSRDIEAVLAGLQHRLCQIIEFHRKLRAGRSN